jgi:hypothetical protein
MGYSTTQMQVERQIVLFRTLGTTSARVKTAGRKAKLNNEQINNCYEWVLEKKREKRGFHSQTPQKVH